MIGDNLLVLRKLNRKTQEDVASAIGVTRQALSKWENNVSMPDINNCVALAEYFNVSVDDLIRFDNQGSGMPVPPIGRKHMFGVVTIDAKGQIVIPKRARNLFQLEPGDRIVVLGSEGEGIALIKESNLVSLFRVTMGMSPINE